MLTMKDRKKTYVVIFYDSDVYIRNQLVERFTKNQKSIDVRFFKIILRKARSLKIVREITKQSPFCRLVVDKNLSESEKKSIRDLFYSLDDRKRKCLIQGI